MFVVHNDGSISNSVFFFQDNQALLLFETHEFWVVSFPEKFFEIDCTLATFLDQAPNVTRKSLNIDGLEIDTIFHAECYHPDSEQSNTDLLLAFLKAKGVIYLVQTCLPDGNKIVKHKVPPAVALNGKEGDITAVRFW